MKKFVTGPVLGIIAFSILVFFIALAFENQHQNQVRADKQSHELITEFNKTINQKICDIAVPSWRLRVKLIHDTNSPSKIAPDIDLSTAEGKAIKAQVNTVNVRKRKQLADDLKLNGPKPC